MKQCVIPPLHFYPTIKSSDAVTITPQGPSWVHSSFHALGRQDSTVTHMLLQRKELQQGKRLAQGYTKRLWQRGHEPMGQAGAIITAPPFLFPA